MKRQKLILLSLILLIGFIPQMRANAEQNIKTLRTPIPFKINCQLNPSTTPIGETAELVIPEDIIYKKMRLKKDTILSGTVKKFKVSKRYRRNGYFEIVINSINYPDKGLINLEKTFNVKIYDPEIMHRRGKPTWMKTSEGILFCSDCAIGGTSLPLYLYENFKWDETMKDKSKTYKWGNALSKTLVVYYIYDFFKKYPDPDYKVGDIVNIKLTKKTAKEVFLLDTN